MNGKKAHEKGLYHEVRLPDKSSEESFPGAFLCSLVPCRSAAPSIPAGHSIPAGRYARDPVQIGHTQQKNKSNNVNLLL